MQVWVNKFQWYNIIIIYFENVIFSRYSTIVSDFWQGEQQTFGDT